MCPDFDPTIGGQLIRTVRKGKYIVKYKTTGKTRNGAPICSKEMELDMFDSEDKLLPKNTLLNVKCSGLNTIQKFSDGSGGSYEMVIETTVECGATHCDVRQNIVKKINYINDVLDKGNVLTNDQRKATKALLSSLEEFVRYSPTVVDRQDGLYVQLFHNEYKMNFIDTVLFRLFGKIPKDYANEVHKKAYRNAEFITKID